MIILTCLNLFFGVLNITLGIMSKDTNTLLIGALNIAVAIFCAPTKPDADA